MGRYGNYEAVIGLEVHAQILTESKAFSPEAYVYGDSPNSDVSVVTLAHPGTLPRPNLAHFKLATKMGFACHTKIHRDTTFARKNYFYPDLPKGYQITQDSQPLCTDGYLIIRNHEGKERKIRIQRIHIEEDSGKSIHDLDPFYSLVDLNRAGVPLIEIVTEPDMKYPEEAYQYLTEIRKLVRYLEICDGNMEEGSLRCDANVSVRKIGESKLGTKVEVKNLNSIRNVQRAIEHEISRQIEAIENGVKIETDTRSFDAVKGTTTSMRSKELASDYRYFPEPDLPPVSLSQTFLDEVKAEMPELPYELQKKFVNTYGLSTYDADVLTADKHICHYFESVINLYDNYKVVANWIIGPVKSYLNEKAIDIGEFPLKPEQIANMAKMVEDGKLSFSVASGKLFNHVVKAGSNCEPEEIANKENLIQIGDESEIHEFVSKAIAKYPDKVEAYKNGKTGLLGLFMGEVMKMSEGKADPKQASELLKKELS